MLSCEGSKEMTEKSIDTVRHLIIEVKQCLRRQLGVLMYKKYAGTFDSDFHQMERKINKKTNKMWSVI